MSEAWGNTGSEDYMPLVDQYMQAGQGDLREAWALAEGERRKGNHSQTLADAEHYLWAQYYGQQNPWKGITGMVLPAGYNVAKRAGLLSGADTSAPTMAQLGAGTSGAWQGLRQGLLSGNW